MALWSLELKHIVHMCIVDSWSATIWWHKSRIIMYNEEYAAMLGKRHPSVLDQGSTRAWPELRGSFDQHFGRGKEIGELLKGDDTFYITERNG
jgi:hypothetical protein